MTLVTGHRPSVSLMFSIFTAGSENYVEKLCRHLIHHMKFVIKNILFSAALMGSLIPITHPDN